MLAEPYGVFKKESQFEYTSIRVKTLAAFLGADNLDEKALLIKASKLSPEKKELILKNIFLNSRDYALQLARLQRETITLDDTVALVKILEGPCFLGNWEKISHAYRLERTSCPLAEEKSPFICQYWQEALDGLIMGFGNSERLARHRSIMKGKNDNCLDVIYDSDNSDYRWGEVPRNLIVLCKPLLNRLEKIKVELTFNGYSENTLFYTIYDKNEKLSGFRRPNILKTIRDYFKNKEPEIELMEISPRAVIEGEF